MNLAGLDAAWIWLGIAAVLAITELLLPGAFLVWIATAALLTALITFLIPLALPFQLVLFGLFAIGAVLAGRRVYDRAAQDSSDPLLNDRAARLIGETVTVVAAIENGQGRVKVGDGAWPARGPDAALGSRVRITGADGACLRVTPIAELAGPSSD